MFLVFGAPHILQSDNGRKFTASVITELKELVTELVIVHGKPRYPQSQASVERSNSDIHDMVVSWMRENNTTSWETNLKICTVSERQARSCRNKVMTIQCYIWMYTQSSYSK